MGDETELIKKRYVEYPVLSEYFPLVLKNKAEVKGVVAHCSECSRPIGLEYLRGEMRETVADCYRITSIGLCTACNLFVSYLFHVIPSGDAYAFTPMAMRRANEIGEPNNVLQLRPAHQKKRRAPRASANT